MITRSSAMSITPKRVVRTSMCALRFLGRAKRGPTPGAPAPVDILSCGSRSGRAPLDPSIQVPGPALAGAVVAPASAEVVEQRELLALGGDAEAGLELELELGEA